MRDYQREESDERLPERRERIDYQREGSDERLPERRE